MSHFLIEEQRYLSGLDTFPTSESFLEVETISPTTVTFNAVLLICSCLGVIFSFLLIVGVYKDIKFLLLPWVIIMVAQTAIEVIHSSYLLYLETLDFNPMSATLFTLDFFIDVANVYAIICVISQYQEFRDGRGTAIYDIEDRVATVEFTAAVQQNTVTTFTSGGPKTRTSSLSLPPTTRLLDVESSVVFPTKPPSNRPKKHVQFPNEQTIVEDSISDQNDIIEERKETSIASLWMEREPATPLPER